MTKQKKEPNNKDQQKYVDDMTENSALNLKNLVVPNANPTKDLPKQFHERIGLIIPVEQNPFATPFV